MHWEKLVDQFANKSDLSKELVSQVESLTKFLEKVVSEKEDETFLEELVDLPQLAARAFDEGDEEAFDKMEKQITDLSTDEINRLLRYYTVFFHLMNSQEQREITRINRERAINTDPESPRGESIAEAVYFLKEEGYSAQEAADVIAQLDIQPTITAHPTEARRHSVMMKQQHITKMINKLGQGNLTPDERHQTTIDILNEVHLLLATDEVRSEKVTVEDEVENGMFFFMNAIWDTVPVLYDDLRRAFNTYYNEVPDFSTILRYRSWIGSDRDGNPNVTDDVTWNTVLEQRKNVMNLYLDELDQIRSYLSISQNKFDISDELSESLLEDEKKYTLSERYQRLYNKEPYRRKITFMMHKLEHQLELIAGENKAQILAGAKEYTSEDFIAELELISDSLVSTGLKSIGELGTLKHLLVRANTFGFHMAALDIRQHSKIHEDAVAELLSMAQVCDNYSDLEEADKVDLLVEELKNPRPLSPLKAQLGDQTAQMLEVFGVIDDMLSLDPQSFGSYIISMTHSVSDFFEVMILAKEVGLWSIEEGNVKSPIDVVPLFETIEDLSECGRFMTEIFETDLYQNHLKARNELQEIMLGYSDSNKDGGYWMANWALEQGQQDLGKVCRKYDVDFRLFHGRGGTVGRGGGRSNQAILALPPISNNGRIRFTEQGEVISFRYSLPDITRRHLEQIVNAMIRVTVAEKKVLDSEGAFFGTMETVANRSMEAYRDLIDEEGFWEWYTGKTPIEHISRLPIASRPVSRGSTKMADFDNLRAIPWNFAWTQVRYNVPGWYGTGVAFHKVIEEDDQALANLKKWYKNDIFFKSILDNTQREMARTHIQTSTIYPDNEGRRFHESIIGDFEKAKEAILKITEEDEILGHSNVILNSIKFRNPFTYPLNMIQVELLDRWSEHTEEEENKLRDALFLSINGIAAAMQSTG
ncbi:phosphoenolpyruvate carboxylase [Fodinibius salsisoli]|uniref:Phosphoenolpyruvate carboxylase n=1 Tax=Fodinibius salsisoli TaxID=2820877 RepID=A0ABT3PRW5_9BACT|nr:phosphoenolpyruvate carboxylase [Fodinibius salsisoli]MCW9708610.1 phosphoenolpyruvate carboxylase [Fodinibius salsisoli]